MKYEVRIKAYIEAKDDQDAARQAAGIDTGLKNPLLRSALQGLGVKPLGHAVDPKPIKV